MPRLALIAFIGALSLASTVEAQQRTNEAAMTFGFGGTARRDLGIAQTTDDVMPSYGLTLRFGGRLAEHRWGDIHVGGQIAGTAWQTQTLRETEEAWRTLIDAGPFVRYRGPQAPFAPVAGFSLGFSMNIPSIPGLYEGVAFGVGLFSELWGGLSWRRRRALLGLEIAWSHHRLASSTPDAVTTLHQVLVRVVAGWGTR